VEIRDENVFGGIISNKIQQCYSDNIIDMNMKILIAFITK